MKTYKDINGWFNFENFYNRIVNSFALNNMNFVEIGVFDGKSLSYLVQNILKTQTNVNFYAVDKWINDIDFNRFILNMKECGIKDYINIIREESIVASKKF